MKLVEITKEEYDKYWNKCENNHFLSSSDWVETCRLRIQTPVYLALKDDNDNVKAAIAMVRKDTYFNLSYFYAPRGFLIDFKDKELLEEFTKQIKVFLKNENAIYLRIDPAIVYNELDENAQPIVIHEDAHKLINTLISLGYKHRGFNKVFNGSQPRHTFRINTKRPMEDIEKSFNKTFLKTVKRSYNYDLEVTDNFNPDTFYKLMLDIANKNNFNGNPKPFFEEFFKNFSKNNHFKGIVIKIYPDRILNKAREDLAKLEKDLSDGKIIEKHKADVNNQIERYKKDIETFKEYEGKYPNGLDSLSLICPITNHAMWTLYIGNNALATYTFAVNRAYYEAIKYAHDNNLEFLDLFGTSGDPHTTIKNYASIHEYKRKMGGTYTEFIGDFDLVTNKFWYTFLPPLLKYYRKFVNKLKLFKRKKNQN